MDRNDTDGAIAAYRQAMDADMIYPAFVQTLIMLQDDPADLLAEIERVNPLAQRKPAPFAPPRYVKP